MKNQINLKYEALYQHLNDLNLTNAVQNFTLSNNTDIIKSIEYFRTRLQNASDEKKQLYEDAIENLEFLMIKRLAITEDLFRSTFATVEQAPETVSDEETKDQSYYDSLDDVSKTEKDEDADRTVKTIQHPATKKIKTLNDKLGAKSDVAKVEEKSPAKVDKNKFRNTQSTFHKNYPTDEAKEERFNEMLPKIKKYLDKGDRDSARNVLKLTFYNFGVKSYTPFYTSDLITESILNWIESDIFVNRKILYFIKNKNLFSISEVVQEAEHQIKFNGLGEKDVKDMLKPYFFGLLLEKDLNIVIDTIGEPKKDEDCDAYIKRATKFEEDAIKKADLEYDDKFNRLISFLFDKEFKVENMPKDRSRNELQEEAYNAHSTSTAKNKVVRMANTLHKLVKSFDDSSAIKDRVKEICTYLKVKNPKLLEEYLENTSKPSTKPVSKSKSKTKAAPKKKETPKVEKSTEEAVEAPVNTKPETKVEPEVEVEVETVEDTITPALKEYAKQLNAINAIDGIQEYLINLINKTVIKGLKTNEEKESVVYTLATDKLLSNTIKLDATTSTADWTEADVAQWISEFVIPFTTELYSILSCHTTFGFKKALAIYLEQFPAGNEKARQAKLKEVLTSKYPRTDFVKKLAKKVRRDKFYEIDNMIEEIYQESKTK